MFGIGFSELVLIVLAVILFVRPTDLPKFFRQAGRAWAYVKKGLAEANAVKDAFMKQIDEVAKLDDTPAIAGKGAAAELPPAGAPSAETAKASESTPKSEATQTSDVSPTTKTMEAPVVPPPVSVAPAIPPRSQDEPAFGPKPLASFDASDPASGKPYAGNALPGDRPESGGQRGTST